MTPPKPALDWKIRGKHVWYFAFVDQILTVDDLQHWYWYWQHKPNPYATYLGEL